MSETTRSTDRIPALVVSGFLGSGKTTLVRRLLEAAQREGIRVAIVSNELGELGIDRALLGGGAEAFIELEGGCVCCELSDDLVETLQRLYEEIRGRIKETDLSVPDRKGPWWYLSRTEEGKQYGIACRRSGAAEGPQAREQVLLDCNALAGDAEYFALGAYEVSPDHRTLAYSTDFSGAELYTMHFRDLETGRDRGDEKQAILDELAEAEKGLAEARTALDALHELARREGVPPGWIRTAGGDAPAAAIPAR